MTLWGRNCLRYVNRLLGREAVGDLRQPEVQRGRWLGRRSDQDHAGRATGHRNGRRGLGDGDRGRPCAHFKKKKAGGSRNGNVWWETRQPPGKAGMTGVGLTKRWRHRRGRWLGSRAWWVRVRGEHRPAGGQQSWAARLVRKAH